MPLLFGGHIELALSSSGRVVRALTNKYVVYEFWKCAFHDPYRILKIAEFLFERRDSNMLYYLQESWPTYKDPYLRSGLFFLLNRISESGYQSSGRLNYDSYNPVAANRLKKLNKDNLGLFLSTNEDFMAPLSERPESEYVVIPAANFSYNLFEHGASKGWETTIVDHTAVKDFLTSTDKKTVAIYKNHGALDSFFGGFSKIYLNEYGVPVKDLSQASEVLVANFRIN